jgi:hypothetical protein
MSAASPGLHLSSTGSYPRIGDTFELQLLRRTLSANHFQDAKVRNARSGFILTASLHVGKIPAVL